MATHASPEVRRAQILEAALRCFGEKGFHASRVDDIARHSGLSKGAIYWQFESKEEIFLALFDAYEQAIFSEWETVDESDAAAALEREGRIALERMIESRPLVDTWVEFMRYAPARDRLAAVYVRSRARLADTIRRGVERGQLRACDPVRVASALTALVEGLLLQAMVDPDFDALAAWPAAWSAIAQGLVAQPASESS